MATKTKPKGKFAWPSAPAKKVHTRSWADEQKRVKTAKLDAPIVPGSSVTERALAKAATGASTTRYSPLEAQQQETLGQAQGYQRDVGGPGGFYDQYLQQLAANAANVNTINQQANQAVLGTQNAVTGLAGADLTQLQGQANQGAAARGMGPAGDLSGMASNAAAIRQALVGSFGAQQAARGAAAQTYAGGLANVVGPTQKLAGQAIAAGKVTAAQKAKETTAREKGAYESQYKAEQRASESKNVLAEQIATGKSAADLAKANLAAKTSVTTTKIRAGAQLTAAQIRSEASQAAADTKAAAKADEINKYGYSNAQWARHSPAWREQKIKSFTGSGKGKGGAGPDWQTQLEQGSAGTQVGLLKDLVEKAIKGQPFVAGHAAQPKMTRAQAEKKVAQYAGSKLKNPMILRAAADAIVDGHLSAYTVKHLISAGYKPSEIATALKTTTHGQWIKTPAGQAWLRQQRGPSDANTKAYGQGGNLGQTGHK